MNGTEFQLACLRDERLAAHALSPTPIWLWSVDATRVLWANPVAAAIFDAASPAALAAMQFAPTHAAAAQVARMAGTLPAGNAPRLERLRGFGAGYGSRLLCLCSRIALADNTPAVLVVSAERAGKDLSLPERAQRLLAGLQQPASIFSADGELIAETPQARERFGDKRDLTTLGADQLAREATLNGHADGEIGASPATILRLGAGPTLTLLAMLGTATQPAPAAAPVQAAPSVPNPVIAQVPPRRIPVRFVWQTDADNRFTFGGEDFSTLLGPDTNALLGRPWAEIAAALKLDPQGAVANALAARNTFSGLIVPWPVDDAEPLPVELSGLPVFDRDRQFSGFRGFGLCRDVERLAGLEGRQAEHSRSAVEVKPPTDNVVAFPVAAEEPPALSSGERSAFEELARELSARLKGTASRNAEPALIAEPPAAPRPTRNGDAARDLQQGRPIFDRLPVGLLVYRLNTLLYANRAFLDWTGYASLEALNEAGGLDSLFIDTKAEPPGGAPANGKSLTIATIDGHQKPVDGRLFSAPWNDESALVLMISTQTPVAVEARGDMASLRRLENENDELKSILDTATDGVLVLDRAGRVLSANRSAEALFGYEAADFANLSFGDLFAPESRRSVLDYFDRVAKNGSVLDTGREAIGLVRQGGLAPLYFTMGRIAAGEKLCAVLRDITAWKRTEEDLISAKQQAERASTAKSEFLAKISHEIRTPLNAIIGFAEVMMEERFGPVANDRYRQYLRDIHACGGHLISLLNDLLDLSKIEAGRLELSLISINLNDLVQQCVAILQPQANRERVIIRTSLPPNLPPIVADARSVRQIALNLLSNSIKFTGAGGQVIVATAFNDAHEIVLRVRDTGPGMSERDLQTAMEPFRQLATASRAGSAGLGLPISKALAEANRARFHISSQIDEGTLVEVAFPMTRVLAK
ncbi:MAG TPA: histidine kinase dimerization/phospho-acceptor domain-containing protein [Pseudolabrys sp.]|nr:histidine kinase dimerization/phospho-acceptor domain-containing protein [Pseudolabrys sp.]